MARLLPDDIQNMNPFMLNRFIFDLVRINADMMIRPEMDFHTDTYHGCDQFTDHEYADYIQSGGSWEYVQCSDYMAVILSPAITRLHGLIQIGPKAQKRLADIGMELAPANTDEAHLFDGFYLTESHLSGFIYTQGNAAMSGTLKLI